MLSSFSVFSCIIQCYLCGKTGHVRRECPGILDDGRGESKYTKSNGDAGAVILKPSKGRKNKKQHQPQQHYSRGSGDDDPLALPAGFEKNIHNSTEKGQKISHGNSSRGNSSGRSTDTEPKEASTAPPHFLYFDAGCDDGEAVLDYLRFGRHGHASGRKKNHRKYQANPHNHTQISRGDAISEYDTAMETVCETTNFGGCILRAYVPPPWERTRNEGDEPSSWNPHDSVPFSWFHKRPSLLKFVVGYPCPECDEDGEADDHNDNNDDDGKDDNREIDAELVAGLVELALAHQGTVVGFFADLDYASVPHPEAVPPRSAGAKRFERVRRFQLRRLRSTLRAAAEIRCPVQIRIAPGYKACQLSPTSDAVTVGDIGASKTAAATDGYSQAIRDLGAVLLETSASCRSASSTGTGSTADGNSNPEGETDLAPNAASPSPFRVHLSCWNGKAEHLVALGGAFPPDQLVFGFDGRLGFSKAVHLHESAFEVSIDRIVLETGGAGILPPVVAKHGGRNAFCHPGHLPFVAEELARHAGKNPRNHTVVNDDDGGAASATVPTAAMVARCAAATTKALYGLP